MPSIADASPEALAAALALFTPRTNAYVRLVPTVKQAAFLLLDQREVFYGGAAGGGKTAGILAAALQYVDVPGYSALLLRRNFKQLSMPGSWIPLSHEWLDQTDAEWHKGEKQWTFPSGATLTFGFVGQPEEDRRKYETAAFQFIGIDELTAWREEDYRFLFSRLRRPTGFPVFPRMRAASNPGGRGHEWVKRRFVTPDTRIRRAVFIPANLDDNPYLDRDDYIASLQELHPVHWQRLLYGDWDIANPGEMFQPRQWYADHPELMVDGSSVADARIRYWDLAASEPNSDYPDPDWTAGVRMARRQGSNGQPIFTIEHVVRVRRTAGQIERLIAETARSDPDGTAQWMEQEPGASGKSLVDHFRRDVMPTSIPMRASRSRLSKGARARPLAGAMENGRVETVRAAWTEVFFDELEAFSEDPSHSGAHDDMVDSASGAFNLLEKGADGGGTSAAVMASMPRLSPLGSARRTTSW